MLYIFTPAENNHGLIFFPGLDGLYLLHNQLKQKTMKTLAFRINLVIATLCMLVSAAGFFGAILTGHLFQGVFFGFLTVIAIGILKLTIEESA
jgi:hypothetical protein